MLQFDWPAGSLTNHGRLVNILIQRQLHHYRIRLKVKRREVYLCDTELEKTEFEIKNTDINLCFPNGSLDQLLFYQFQYNYLQLSKCQKVFFSFPS